MTSTNTKPVVLITGALTGIGRATALAFARDGANIVVSGRRDDVGAALVRELKELGAEAEYINSDVRHDDSVANLVDQTVARFGRLDIAVNNAGTKGSQVRSSTKPPTPTTPLSTPTCWACC